MSGTQTLFVVRHAVAADRHQWSGPDGERPLTPEGEGQAARLADLLGGEGIRLVASSPALRCRQTVAPLAERIGEPVSVFDGLQEGVDAADMVRSLVGLRRPAVAGCTHGDVLEGLLELLARDDLLPAGRPRCKKGSTWVLGVRDGDIRSARYLPPP